MATTETSLSQMRQASEPEALPPGIVAGLGTSDAFALIQRQAKVFATSTLVPKEYQGNISNCIIAMNMANRLQADVLMVMQNLYVVHGKPGWSAQFLIATFNTSGRFGSLQYEFFGNRNDDTWGCRAWALDKDGEKLYGSDVTIEIAKKEGWYAKNGSKWQTMPQQMLMYRAASWFVRAFAPEIGMGLHTVEELRDVGTTDDPSFITNFDDIKNRTVNVETGEITLDAKGSHVADVTVQAKNPNPALPLTAAIKETLK